MHFFLSLACFESFCCCCCCFLDSNGSDNLVSTDSKVKYIRYSYRNRQKTENKGEIAETDMLTDQEIYK